MPPYFFQGYCEAMPVGDRGLPAIPESLNGCHTIAAPTNRPVRANPP